MERNESLTQALHLYQIKQYDEAFIILKRLVKKEDLEAIHTLALCYLYGQGTKPNLKEAFSLFQRGKETGYSPSMRMLGSMLETGKATIKDEAKAFELYSAAFHNGDLSAGLEVARCHEKGIGTPINKAKALETYVECAKREEPYALYRIGIAYLYGDGIKKSIENAHLWLNKALAKGSVEAMNQFRLVGTKSHSDERSLETLWMTATQLMDQARYEDALPYLMICEKEGLYDASIQLAKVYDEGLGVLQDSKKAFEIIAKAAAKGHPLACFSLAKRFEEGRGIDSNFLKAEAWYQKSFEFGYEPGRTEALALRGELYA